MKKILLPTLALAIMSCATPKPITTLAHWPDGARDITSHAQRGDAAYDTAYYNDSLVRYPIWHRLDGDLFAVGMDTVREFTPRPLQDTAGYADWCVTMQTAVGVHPTTTDYFRFKELRRSR